MLGCKHSGATILNIFYPTVNLSVATIWSHCYVLVNMSALDRWGYNLKLRLHEHQNLVFRCFLIKQNSRNQIKFALKCYQLLFGTKSGKLIINLALYFYLMVRQLQFEAQCSILFIYHIQLFGLWLGIINSLVPIQELVLIICHLIVGIQTCTV